MSDDNKDSGSPPHNRRSSFGGQTLAELFGANRNRSSFAGDPNSNTSNGISPLPGSVASAAAQAHRRRMSIGGIGLVGTSPSAGSTGNRSESVSSSNSGAIDEMAVEEGGSLPAMGAAGPFARRVSFGARAFRDVRSGSVGGGVGGGGATNGRSSIPSPRLSSAPGLDAGKKTNPPTPKGRADSGYNWADNFRSRAERSASIASSPPTASPTSSQARLKSQAPAPPTLASPREVKPQNVPDHFQERILKGDFYMD